MVKRLAPGKVPADILKGLLRQFNLHHEQLLIPPGMGCDAAGLELKSDYWAFSMDPVTFVSNHQAQYVVEVNINDVVCMGCRPEFFMSTILLPEGFTDHQLQSLWQTLVSQLNRHPIQIIGGHTEVTPAVNRPVIVGQMFGALAAPRFYDPQAIQVGDQILLCRPVAVEGTAILASEYRTRLLKDLPESHIETMAGFIHQYGLSILPIGEKLFDQEGVVALHDPTEGGVATALHELADASKLGLKVDESAITVLSETRQLAELLDFDPLGVISSGCLLIVCRPAVSDVICSLLGAEGASVLGEFHASPERQLVQPKGVVDLPRFDQDELARLWK